ncbi:hypothetical protein [Flavobacterium aquicola]|uniref:Uncharacterized protein n=1 Tax=Flavobacterium aquicola TaxID=1682742 RepID=A0A3E0EVX8_9FLAO|nr:hypothetical protein [Flavobacterium aquicola]REH01994.1 hypothetical protein C8P67_101482 [Flavobacterium aquicola]
MQTKKTAAISIIILSLITVISCNELDKLLTFTVSDEVTFKINSGLSINTPFEVATPDVTTNSSTEFNNNNTDANLVKDATLREIKLSILNPADKTFSFLKSVHIYISTTADDEIELAYLDNINTAVNTINLTCTTKNLDKYIKASSYKLRTAITTKETYSQDIEVKANISFKVTADPFN